MKRLTAFLVIFIILASTLSPTQVFSAQREVSAKHAALYEPITHTFLYEKNGHTRAPMASTTKIMTALVVLENADLNSTVTITEADCGAEGSSIYMVPGEKLTIRDLLYALLLQSANDAATALANHVGGSVDAFAQMMNARVNSIGLFNTHFANPHGLDNEEHYTTACDLAQIAAVALEHPIFRDIVSTVKYSIPGRDGGTRVLINHNKLLRMYDDAVGVKTGFTKKSGRCLVGAAERNGLSFVSVTLDAPNDWNDHIAMFEDGFQMLENRLLCDVKQFVYEIPVIGGDVARCTNAEAVYAILPPDATPPEIVLDLPHFLLGNEKIGSVIGAIQFQYQNTTIAQCPLVLMDNS